MSEQLLTPEQEAKLPEYRDRWLKYGLSTEVCDFGGSMEGAKEAYAAANVPWPELHFVGASPIHAACIGAVVEHLQFQSVDDLRKQIADTAKEFELSDEETAELSASFLNPAPWYNQPTWFAQKIQEVASEYSAPIVQDINEYESN